MSSEITPRKFIFPRKSLENFRRNSEETPRTTSSSEKSSEYTEGGLPRNILMDFPMVQSLEVPTKRSSEFSSGISEERGPRIIPRNSLSVYFDDLFRGNVRRKFSRVHFLGISKKIYFFKLKFLNFNSKI